MVKEQRGFPDAVAGDIVAVAKLKDTATGDSLCTEKDQVVFEPIAFPEPAISFSIKPKTRGDEDKISIALHKLTSFHICRLYKFQKFPDNPL